MRGTKNSGVALTRNWIDYRTIIDVLLVVVCATAVIMGVQL